MFVVIKEKLRGGSMLLGERPRFGHLVKILSFSKFCDILYVILLTCLLDIADSPFRQKYGNIVHDFFIIHSMIFILTATCPHIIFGVKF